jgi:hypothetical protein
VLRRRLQETLDYCSRRDELRRVLDVNHRSPPDIAGRSQTHEDVDLSHQPWCEGVCAG